MFAQDTFISLLWNEMTSSNILGSSPWITDLTFPYIHWKKKPLSIEIDQESKQGSFKGFIRERQDYIIHIFLAGISVTSFLKKRKAIK